MTLVKSTNQHTHTTFFYHVQKPRKLQKTKGIWPGKEGSSFYIKSVTNTSPNVPDCASGFPGREKHADWTGRVTDTFSVQISV